jgi:hypothetical protein
MTAIAHAEHFANFPAASEAIVAEAREGSIMGAVKAYHAVATAELNDGTVVRMARGAAFRYIVAIRRGLPALPVAVSEEIHAGGRVTRNYEDIDLQAKRDAAEALKWERFHLFCEEDGHKGSEPSTEQCRHCGEEREGTTHFAPDAMGYPTPVLWTCGTCGQTS